MSLTMTSAPRAEFLALRREPDGELRGEGLLSLAGRQEHAHRRELAIEIYQEILNSSETPEPIRERAQRRLDAHLGQGGIGDRAEVLLSRFSEEATEPTSLLAMTVAGAAFRATRFLTLSRLAANPNASLLTRGLGMRAMAGLSGYGVEAAVFPLAGRLGNLALGREQEWNLAALGRELGGSFLMLGALRAGGLATGVLASRTSYLRPLIQQTGMYGGILLGQELEVRAGLRERTSGSLALVDGLSTLLQFNVAGRLSRGLMGEGLRRWEAGVEMQSEALSRPSPWRIPRGPSLGARPALAGVHRGAGSEIRPTTEDIGPDRAYMSGEGGNGDGPRRPLRDRSNDTLPFITMQGQEQSPYHIQHPMELGRRIRTPELGFEKRIREVNVEFFVDSIFPIEPFIPSFIDQLNRMLTQGLEIDPKLRRQVIINVEAREGVMAQRIILQRNASGFERMEVASEPPPTPPRTADPFAKTLFAATPPALDPAQRSEPVTPLRPTPPPKPARPLPLITDRAGEIPQLLIKLSEFRTAGEGTPILIVEGLALEDTDLLKLTEGLAPRLPEHATFDVLVPQSEMTYSGLRIADQVKWLRQYQKSLEWKAALGRAIMPQINVGSVAELYRQIYALGRKEHRLPDAETVLRLQGELAPEGLADFTLQALNRYSVTGRHLRVETENTGNHEFLGEAGSWRLAETPASSSKPASRPPLTAVADHYHTARWRSGLTQFLQDPNGIVGRHHEFFLLSPMPLSPNDLQGLRQRLQNGAADLELLRIHDQAGQKVWSFQRQGGEWTLEESVWEAQLRWRPHGEHPQGAIEANDLMDLLRQLPGTFEGAQPLHIHMRGPWSAQYAVNFLDVLNQTPQGSLRPSLELHYEGPQAEPRRQTYQRNSHGLWHFLEASEGT